MTRACYEQDFYTWTQEQAAALRAGRVEALDFEHLAEEIESMGRSERHALKSRLGVLIGRLLKWQLQPARRSASWQRTIRVQRREVAELLHDNPGLRPKLDAAMIEAAYDAGVLLAERETGLPDEQFPSACPYALAELLDEAFWPA